MNADELNAALDAAEQSLLRRMAQKNAREGGPRQFYGPDDTFDKIGPGIVVRRNNHVKPLINIPPTEYGG